MSFTPASLNYYHALVRLDLGQLRSPHVQQLHSRLPDHERVVESGRRPVCGWFLQHAATVRQSWSELRKK